jgi:hypothetical protein
MKYLILIATLLFTITAQATVSDYINFDLLPEEENEAQDEMILIKSDTFTKDEVAIKALDKDKQKQITALANKRKALSESAIRLAKKKVAFTEREVPKIKTKLNTEKEAIAAYTYETQYSLATSQYVSENQPEYHIRYNQDAADFNLDPYNGIECYTLSETVAVDERATETLVTCPKKNDLEKALADYVKVETDKKADKIKYYDDTYGTTN